MKQDIIHDLAQASADVIRLQRELTSKVALGPENDGIGEELKAQYIMEELARMGIEDVRLLKAPDERVPCGYRPNIITHLKGKSPRTLWILGHMDVVPAGDITLWKADPFTLRVDGDVLIGRGVEDNQQAIVSALILLNTLKQKAAVPELSLGCIFVADEETGNALGIEWLMHEHAELFGNDDIFIVPDFGSADGSLLEIAEKHVLWLRINVEGTQCHGSTPHKGHNAMLAGSALVLALQELHELFPLRDELFDPPISTFTPTKREANVPNINSVPGRDVFYLDCRILPCYNTQEVKEKAAQICQDIAQKYQVRIELEAVSEQHSPDPTPANSDIVTLLAKAVHELSGVQVKLMGVGGGTVAKEIRQRGLHAAVWSRILSNCHEPEEKALISNAIFDAQVFAHMIFAQEE